MTIKRSTPDIGYVDPAFLTDAGVSQTVRANGMVHFSGIVAARRHGECVAPGDLPGQIRFILEVLERCLNAEGLTFRNLVSTTVYCTDLRVLAEHVELLAEAFREHPPTSTWVQVGGFTHPDYLIELQAIAAED